MPRIQENEAFALAQGIDTLDEAQKPQALDILTRYRDQQNDLGEPQWPSQEQAAQDAQDRVRGMFTGGIDKVPFEVSPWSQDPQQDKATAANLAFLSHRLKKTPQEIADRPDFYRNDYARQHFGQPGGVDEKTFYGLVAKEIKDQQAMELRTRADQEHGYQSALNDLGSLKALAQLGEISKQTEQDVPGSGPDIAAFFQGYKPVNDVLTKHGEFVKETADAVNRSMTGKAKEGDSQIIADAQEKLVDMPGAERRIVIHALMNQAGKAGEVNAAEKGGKYNVNVIPFLGSFWQQMGESAARFGENALTNHMQVHEFLANTPTEGSVKFSGDAIRTPEDARKFVSESLIQQASTQRASGDLAPMGSMDTRHSIQLDAKAKGLIEDAKTRVEKQMRAQNEMRQIGNATDPIPNVIASTLGTSGAIMGSMALTRGFGAPIIANAYANAEYNDLSVKFPQMSHADKMKVASVSGAAQAALDYVGVKGFAGFHVGKLLLNPASLTKQLAVRGAGNAVASFAVENAVEAAQDITTPALIHSLELDVPGFDWQKEQADFWHGRADVAIGMIPLTLIGLGVASVNDYGNGKALLSSNDKLGQMGIPEDVRIATLEAANKGDTAKAEALFQQGFAKRDPAIAAEFQGKLDEQQKADVAIQEEGTRLGLLPDIRTENGKWTVTDPTTGVAATFNSWAEARPSAVLHMNEIEQKNADLVASLADEMMSGKPSTLAGESLTQKGSTVRSLRGQVDSGHMTPEQAMEAAVAANAIRGLPVDEARQVAKDVFGDSQEERIVGFREAIDKLEIAGSNVVQNGQSKSTLNRGATFLTAAEEIIEGRWKAGLSAGRYNKTQMLQWVRTAEQATGEQYLTSMTDEQVLGSPESAPRSLTEAISRIVVAEVLGRKLDGKRIGPGAVTRSLDEQNAEHSKLIAILRAFRQWLKSVLQSAQLLRKAHAEGKLGDEYDAILDDLLGTNGQIIHEQGAAQEAQQIYSEANPGPNGETFSAHPSPGGLSEAEVLDYHRSEANGSSYLHLKSMDGTWFDVRVADHENRTSNPDNKTPKTLIQSMKRVNGITQEDPVLLNILVDRPLSESETKRLAQAAAKSLTPAEIADGLDGEEITKDARFEEHQKWEKWALAQPDYHPDKKRVLKNAQAKLPLARALMDEAKSQSSPQGDRNMSDRGSAKTGAADSLQSSPEVNPEPSPGGLSEAEADQAAKQRGLIKVFHGTDAAFDRLDVAHTAQGVLWFASDKGAIERGDAGADGRGRIITAYIQLKKPAGWNEYESLSTDELIRDGYDGVILPEDSGTNYIVFNNNQVFTAQDLLRPEPSRAAGETFSIQPGDFSSRMSAKFSQFQSNPEQRMKIAQVAKARAQRLGAEWIEKAAVLRSSSSVGKDARMREALAYETRMNEYLDGLTPAARQDIEFEPSKLEDDPLIHAMLDHGKLMSRSTAAQQGKLSDKAGEYDGVPWLPPGWYSKGAGIMPDQMAQAMHDAGLLSDAHTDTLWQALAARIASSRKDKARAKEAAQGYKDAQKYARDASRAEADKWAEGAKKKAGSPKAQREMLKAALRTLDGILAAAPPEVRARVGGYVKLAGLATDEAMLQEIERRIEKLNVELEKWLKKKLTESIDKTLEKNRSTRNKKGVMEGRTTANITEMIDFAAEFKELSQAEQDEKLLAYKGVVEDDKSTQDQIDSAMLRSGLGELFYQFDKQDAAALSNISDWLNDVVAKGRDIKKALDADRKEWLAVAKESAVTSVLGVPNASKTDADNVTQKIKGSTLRSALESIKGAIDSVIPTVAQQFHDVFGVNADIGKQFIPRIWKAANESTDIKRYVEAERKKMLARVFKTGDGKLAQFSHIQALARLQQSKPSGVFITEGRKTEEVKIPVEILQRLADGAITAKDAGLSKAEVQEALDQWAAASDRTKTATIERETNPGSAKELDMSEMQALNYWLHWNQAAVRARMELHGWTEESAKQLEAFMSSETKEIGRWMGEMYATAGRSLVDPVYRRIYHAPLPHVTNFAPTFYDAGGNDNMLDLDQQHAGSGIMAGFTKGRRPHNEDVRRVDAMTAFLSHFEHVAHWVSHAEVLRDMKAVVASKEVQHAIIAHYGPSAASSFVTRVKSLEAQGNNQAWGLHAVDGWAKRLNQARAFKALAWRISPIVKQTSALFNPLLADVPAHAFAIGLGKLLTRKLNYSGMWKSESIQRRIEGGFSAEARIAMQASGKGPIGETLLHLMNIGMAPMQATDAAWNTAGAAIAYDYYRGRAVKAGQSEAMAEQSAAQAVDEMLATAAQPADAANRSLIEGSQNPFVKMVWMFASENRKTLAVEYFAAKRLLTGKSVNKAMDVQRIVVAHVVMGVTTQIMASLLALIAGNDDDKDRELSAGEWEAAILAGPINGLFVLGDGINYAIRSMLGLRVFQSKNGFMKYFEDAKMTASHIDDLFDGDGDKMRKEINRLSGSIGNILSAFFGPAAQAPDVILGNPIQTVERALE